MFPTALRAMTAGAAVIAVLASVGRGAAQAPPEGPSACEMRLTSDRAVIKPMGTIDGPNSCGGPDIVHLERIILSDRTSIPLEPPATLRCEMAEAIVNFVRQDLAPAAARMGAPLSAIENFDSYDCRSRNRVSGAPLSEHGRANALDIRAVRLKDGRMVRPADPAAPMEFRVAMKTKACNRFMTVLGPGSDGYHEDHIHVDLADRRSGARLCHWELRTGEPETGAANAVGRSGVAAARAPVPLPRSRPFDAGGLARDPFFEGHP
jgi:hypothetical protein